jgi:septal ring-binding cell division protein DamX
MRTGITFLLCWCAAFLTVFVLSGEEILHPTLIKPAVTKCTVCHQRLEAPHDAEAVQRDCLACHTFVLEANTTYLVTGGDAKATRTRVESSSAESEGHEDGSVLRTGEENPDAVATNTTKPTTSGGTMPDNQEALYEKGLAAFGRRDFAAALVSWRAMLEIAPTSYTVQIAVNRYLASADEAITEYAAHRLFIVQVEDHFFVLAGLYPTRTEAEKALSGLPKPLRQGGAYCVAVTDLF